MLRRRYRVTCTSIASFTVRINKIPFATQNVRSTLQPYIFQSFAYIPAGLGGRRTNFIETPEISGMRSVVHAVLFLTFFYLGFIRRWKRHSITTSDQDNEKIREVVTTWMRATEEGNLETVLSLIAEDAVFLLPDQPPMRGREAFAGSPAFGPWTSPHRRQARYSGDSCRWRLRLLLESAFSDGDSAAGRACPTARWSNIVSLPQRARRALDPLSRCEHAQNSMNAWLVRKG